MTVAELRGNILKNKIENIYLFAGPEIGEKTEIISLLEKSIFKNSKPVKYTFYCANEFNPADFIDTINSNLLFSDKKIIILKNIELANKSLINIIEEILIPKKIKNSIFEMKFSEKLKNKNKEKEMLSFYKKDDSGNYCLKEDIKESEYKKIINLFSQIEYSNINNDTFLILMNESNDRIPAGITNLLTQNQNIMFWEMFDNQKTGWVRMEFKKNNLFIEDNAIEYILEMVENNKLYLENEIQRISASFDRSKNDKNVVTKEKIEEYLYHSKEETAFSLYSALLGKNLNKALEILDKIFYSDDDSILTGIAWSHRRFLRAIDLYENQNKIPEEIYSILGITTKKGKEELNTGFNNYNYNQIAMIFSSLSNLDYYLRILPEDLKIVKLQEFIVSFIMGNISNSFLSGELMHFQYESVL